MGSSVYFNNFSSFGEQNLIEDLVIESISMYGHDVCYCPRTLIAKDDIYGEDAISEYNDFYNIDMYVKSFDSYEGDGTFLSKFNLEIRDQMRFVVAMKRFNNEVGIPTGIERPREGDLIYSPMMKRIFVIMYVNNKPVFYQMGALQMYELTCEVWEYSNEQLNTGIPEIDSIADTFNFALEPFNILTNNEYVITTEDGDPLAIGQFDFDEQNQDAFSDNDEFEREDEDEDVIDWTARDPFSESI